MKRREFIAGLSGTCVWPLAGYAQHLELRRVGALYRVPLIRTRVPIGAVRWT